MKFALPVLGIIIAGLITALEGVTNGLSAKTSGSLYLAMAVALGGGLVMLLAAAPFFAPRFHLYELRTLPWYLWLSGPYVLATIALAAWATPKLGAGPALVAALLAQTALGIALDNFGALGLERAPVTWLKVAGLAVMVVGAAMISIEK